MKKFDDKIAKAVSKAKIRIAAKYNMTPEKIDLILKRRQMAIDKKIEKVIEEEKKALNEAVNDSLQKTLDKTLQASLNQELEKV